MTQSSLKRNIYKFNQSVMVFIFSKRFILFIGVILLVSNCNESDNSNDLPSCIDSKIVEILSNEITNPPTQIWKWMDNGDTYFYITSDCCDQFNYLLNENCEIVCAPDGGITGNGDGNCPDFSPNLRKTLIWEDHRN